MLLDLRHKHWKLYKLLGDFKANKIILGKIPCHEMAIIPSYSYVAQSTGIQLATCGHFITFPSCVPFTFCSKPPPLSSLLDLAWSASLRVFTEWPIMHFAEYGIFADWPPFHRNFAESRGIFSLEIRRNFDLFRGTEFRINLEISAPYPLRSQMNSIEFKFT